LFGSFANSFDSKASAQYLIGEIYWIQLNHTSYYLLFETRPPNKINGNTINGAIDYAT
jgi:hypothetical protein